MTIGVKDKDNVDRTISTVDELLAVLGVVGASPAANTLLDRLKTLNTSLQPRAMTNRSGNVAAAAGNLFAANAARAGFAVKNDTAVDIYINPFGAATVANGVGNIRIPALGGYYESPTGAMVAGAISAISASGTVAITAMDW